MSITSDEEVLSLIRAGTHVVLPRVLTEESRRATWLAQYRHANERLSEPKPDANCIALAEERVQSPTQKASDEAAYEAMIFHSGITIPK